MEKRKSKLEIREVKGYPGYFISNTGILYSNIQSARAKREGGLYEVKPKEHNRGYWEVGLFRKENGVSTSRDWIRVHQLVAAAFIGPKPKGKEVNHKDGNKKNNRADNLEYCTRSENILHSYWHLGRNKKVRSVIYDGKRYQSIKECADMNNLCYNSISVNLCYNKGTHKGKELRYAE